MSSNETTASPSTRTARILEDQDDEIWYTKCWFVAIFFVACNHWDYSDPPAFMHRLNCPGPLPNEIHCSNISTERPIISTSPTKCPNCIQSGSHKGKVREGDDVQSYMAWNGVDFVDMSWWSAEEELGGNGEGKRSRIGLRERGKKLWKKYLVRILY
jgi:hypothetical protein